MDNVPQTVTAPEQTLLPCPFCGSAPYQFEDGEIQCTNKRCLARPSVSDYLNGRFVWNTRALLTDCRLVEENKRLRDVVELILREAEYVADAKAPFSTWVAENCRAALREPQETER